ncbi:MAG: biopolymer transporter ExbD [Burkholderiales bacterium]|nr:biopolymer transporter ExbD [Burkholderiales bacterium]
MTFGGFQTSRVQGKAAGVMADINVTPMVDVMLVLLVIFIITAPLFEHQIKLNLPNVEAQSVREQPDALTLVIDARGRVFMGNRVLSAGELQTSLATAARSRPQPAVQVRADNDTRYEEVAKVMAAAQQAGLRKLAFVTEPKTTQAAIKTEAKYNNSTKRDSNTNNANNTNNAANTERKKSQ